jgi:phospholipase C
MDRRTFLKSAGVGVGLAAAGAHSAKAGLVNLALPSLGVEGPQARTPVEHIVVLMMENRSTNHYLGWYGADNSHFEGRQQAAFPDKDGNPVPTALWGTGGREDFHGRGHEDPNHNWKGGRLERNGGACDGWLHPDTHNDEFALSYYGPDDVPVWAQLTRGWQAYDRWFCSLLGPTQPNRYYMHSGQSGGRTNNSLPPEVAADEPQYAHGWDWDTIWTQLEQKGVSCAYYFSNLPEILFWGDRHIRHARHVSDFYASAAAGTLPQVSFIDPWFIDPQGISNDDHPHADLRLGQAFISDVVEAFTSSPNYRSGALVVTYDEWGGFWDHVDPPRLRDARATPDDPGGADDFGQLGFRIPTSIVSPWTAAPANGANRVDHTVYEHTSVLRFITENWDLDGYLTKRVASTKSIEHAFKRFRTFQPEVEFTPYTAPKGLVLEPTLEPYTGQSDLYTLAAMGWFDGRAVRTDWRLEDSFLRGLPALR